MLTPAPPMQAHVTLPPREAETRQNPSTPLDENEPVIELVDTILREVIDNASRFFFNLERASSWQSVTDSHFRRDGLIKLVHGLLASDSHEEVTKRALESWLFSGSIERELDTRCEAWTGSDLRIALTRARTDFEQQRADPDKDVNEAIASLRHLVDKHRTPMKELRRMLTKERWSEAPTPPSRHLGQRDRTVLPVPQVTIAMEMLVAFLMQPPVRRQALINVIRAIQYQLRSQKTTERADAASVIDDTGPTESESRLDIDIEDLASIRGPDQASEDRQLPATEPVEDSPSPSRDDAPLLCASYPLFLPGQDPAAVRRRTVELTTVPTGSRSQIKREPPEHTLSCKKEEITAAILDQGPDRLVCIREGVMLEDLALLEATFREYKRTPRALRHLEHSDPARELLPPLVPSTMRVGCGRRTCTADLSGLDRDERVCPVCNEPILSRCGNADCLEDFLHLDEDGHAHRCPVCQQENVNLYWLCPAHADAGWLSTADDPCCPRCVEAYGWRRQPRRPDRIRHGVLQCPGCLVTEQKRPFRVPHRVRTRVEEDRRCGFSDEDRRICVESGLSPDGGCPQCQAQLIPFHDRSLGRRPGTASDSRTDLACGFCAFPVPREASSCPRCRLELAVCPVCARLPAVADSSARGRPPKRWYHREGRTRSCDRCGTRQLDLRRSLDLRHLDASVCTNLYDCPTSGLITEPETATLLPAGASQCPVCDSDAHRPIDLRAFLVEVRHCALCTAAMGDPTLWTTESLCAAPGWNGDLDTHLKAIGSQAHTCRVCDRGPALGSPVLEPELEAAALELGRFLWIGKDIKTARGLAQHHWRVANAEETVQRAVADRLLEHTGARLGANLAELCDHFLP